MYLCQIITDDESYENEVEQKMTLHAHIKDAVAVTKFMYWLKTNIGKTEISEISATEYLLNLRKQQDGFIEPSFNTITAYKDHGAMMHYSATKKQITCAARRSSFGR